MPVLLGPDLVVGHTQCAQLRQLAQAAFELGETWEAGEAENVVPQWACLVLRRQPTDHRTEEGDPGRGLEVNDRRTHIFAGQGERLVGLGPDLGVQRGVVQRVGQPHRQARFGQDRLDEGAGVEPGSTFVM